MSAVLLLDVDDTIAPCGPIMGTRDAYRWFSAGFQSDVYVRPAVIDRIRALDCRKVWLTTWEEQAAETFGEAFGFTDHLLGRTRMDGPTTWWKSDVLIELMQGMEQPTRFVWVDDDIDGECSREDVRAVLRAAESMGHQVHIISPEHGVGLTDPQLSLIETLTEDT